MCDMLKELRQRSQKRKKLLAQTVSCSLKSTIVSSIFLFKVCVLLDLCEIYTTSLCSQMSVPQAPMQSMGGGIPLLPLVPLFHTWAQYFFTFTVASYREDRLVGWLVLWLFNDTVVTAEVM